MTSTFMGLEIGKRGIQAHQKAQTVVGHNLDNINTPGYSRQRVEMTTFDPIYLPGLNRAMTPGQIGQGVSIERVERIRDELTAIYRSLKLEAMKLKIANETLFVYLGEIKSTLNDFFSLAFPERCGKMYTKTGNHFSNELNSMVLSRSF